MNLNVSRGFRFADPDLASIMGLLQSWHGEIQDLAYAATIAFLANRCANEIDKAVLKGRPCPRPYEEAASAFLARCARVEREGVSDPQVDFSFSVTILPHEGAAYGLVVTEQARWAERFMLSRGVEPYAYWTGGDEDRPRDVQPQEWAARGELWEAIVRKDPAFRISTSGIVHDFPRLIDFPSAEEVAGAMPSFEDRLRRYARESTIERRMAALDREGVPLATAMLAAVEWSSTEDGRLDALRAREAMRSTLRPALTLADVLGEDAPAAAYG